MKKLLSFIVGFGLTLAASAQQFYSLDFLNARAVQVTNLICVTNLTLGGGYGTNLTGQVWTNLDGTRVVVAAANSATTNDVTKINLLKDIYFPTDFAKWYGQGNVDGTNTVAYPYAAAIEYSVVGGSGANTAGTIVFQLIMDEAGTVSTTTPVSVAVTPAGATAVSALSYLTTRQLFGYKGIRVKYIAISDTDASSQTMITKLRFNCWAP